MRVWSHYIQLYNWNYFRFGALLINFSALHQHYFLPSQLLFKTSRRTWGISHCSITSGIVLNIVPLWGHKEMFQLSTKLVSMRDDGWNSHKNRPKYQLSSVCFNMAKWSLLERDALPATGHRNQPHRDSTWWYKSLRGTDPSGSTKGVSYRHNDSVGPLALSWGQTCARLPSAHVHTCSICKPSQWQY